MVTSPVFWAASFTTLKTSANIFSAVPLSMVVVVCLFNFDFLQELMLNIIPIEHKMISPLIIICFMITDFVVINFKICLFRL